jgi:hypothetical protein
MQSRRGGSVPVIAFFAFWLGSVSDCEVIDQNAKNAMTGTVDRSDR